MPDLLPGLLQCDPSPYLSPNIAAPSDFEPAEAMFVSGAGEVNDRQAAALDLQQNEYTGGHLVTAFGADWYHRVHLIPLHVSLGNLLQGQTRPVLVWNAHLVSRTLQSIDVDGASEGLELSGQDAPPLEFAPLQVRDYSLSITLEGPATIDVRFAFEFEGDETPRLEVTGSRIVMFTYSAQRPLVEVLEFLTDVLQAYSGREQRRMVRARPRNLYRASYLAHGREAARILNTLFGWHGRVFAVPQWQYARDLLADLEVGATSVPTDTAYSDLREGGLVILWRASDDWEVAEILNVDPGRVELARPLEAPHPALETLVLPVHLCVSGDPVNHSRTADGWTTVQVEWRSTETAELAADDGDLTLYKGLPVLDGPNYAADVNAAESIAAEYALLDPGTGTFSIALRREAPALYTAKRWDTEDPAEAWAIRRLLYALRGRQRSFWLPTFRADFSLVETVGASATTLEVESAEYERFVMHEPLTHVAVYLRNGQVFYREIVDVTPAGANELLAIDAAFGQEIAPEDVLRISFLIRSRLDTDAIELVHERQGALAVTVPVVGVLQ